MTTEFQINDYLLTKECDQLARDIFEETLEDMADDETPDQYRDAMNERAHETADGHEWVIYNYKALMLCAHCNTDRGEEFLDDIGFEWTTGESTIYTVATAIAYGEMRARIEETLNDLLDADERAA